MTRRTAVTGVGVFAPGGPDREAFWRRVLSGRPAIRTITAFDPAPFRSRIAAECDDVPDLHEDRYVAMALAAADEAVADAAIDLSTLDPFEVGVSMGTAVGASVRLEEQYALASGNGRMWTVDGSRVTGDLYPALVPSSLAAETAIRLHACGPVVTVSTGCTSGIDAVGLAHEMILDGEADVVLAGASDAPVTPITAASFDAIRATSPLNDDPARASRPFDATREGFVLGEGAAVLVLEELSAARRRGARVYCELSGYAGRANSFHMTGLKPDGTEMAEAIRIALRQARLAPEQIDYISAHGSGTKQNDRHETAAFKLALGDHARRTPISSIKAVVGHSLGAIGAIETAACVLAIRDRAVPPTANLRTPSPECDLDYVPLVAREHRVRHALSVGSGFGGFQSAMVLSELSGGAS
ncbi:beta-ketoacyl-[acyl-carrier-protein] synthase family protein [Amycolatopsis sp. NPDC003676]